MSDDVNKCQTETMDLNAIVQEVGQWSRANFNPVGVSGPTAGQNCSPMDRILGMMEEFGELFTPALSDNVRSVQAEDALGDIGVYLCDFASRDGATLEYAPEPNGMNFPCPPHETPIYLIQWVGKLCHCVLKRHQGIRGYDNPEQYARERDEALQKIIVGLRWHSKTWERKDFLTILKSVWEKVKQRNWAKNPVNAAEEAERRCTE